MEVRKMVQPEKNFRQGSCSASVFSNEIRKNGKTMKMQSVSIQRSYKNGDGWKNTNSYGVNDLPKLIIAAGKAYDYLTAREGAE
jgi:hypothetical protein